MMAVLPAGFEETRTVSTLSSPVAQAFTPDGRLFILEQEGRLRVVLNGQLRPTPAITLNVDSRGERGLLGLAFDPNFASNQYVYLYYTVPNPLHNRLSRFTLSGNVVIAGSERVLADLPNLSAATNHNGGAIHFGRDGKLYLAVGENADPPLSQTLTTPFGKMLRFNSDGSIPTDNPFYSQTTGLNRAIWSTGLRNPFTFAFHPTDGRLFINDVGQNRWEEINVGVRGANYGWPSSEGNNNLQPGFTAPLFTYSHIGATPITGRCIAGGVFYSGSNATNFPANYRNDYFFADFVNGFVASADLSSPTPVVTTFATSIDQPVDLDVGPDGALYVLTRNGGGPSAGGVSRIRSVALALPSVTQQPAPRTAAVGQPVAFEVVATGANLRYQWQRNGVNISNATQSRYTIASATSADNAAQFRVVVSNPTGSVTSNQATLTVTNLTNTPPAVAFTQPTNTLRFIAGQRVNFAATANDVQDGVVPASRYTWQVDYHTGSVARPFVAPSSGVISGSFTPPTQTPYTATDVFYRITLRVSDSRGATTTIIRDVQPLIVRVTIASTPDRATFQLDGQPFVARSFNAVAGLTRLIAAPARRFPAAGGWYSFVSWNTGRTREHAFSTPTTDVTYTATYVRDQDRRAAPATGRSVPGSITQLQLQPLPVSPAIHPRLDRPFADRPTKSILD